MCCTPRILIAEDNEFNMETVVQLLKAIDSEIELVEAQNGKIALQKFRESLNKPCNCPDKGFRLILMDIQMPVMGGIEAAEKIIKERPTTIVALTSYTAKDVHK